MTDFLAGVVTAAGVAVADTIKYALYLLNKALFALYRAIRDVLVLQAYSIPYTEEITGSIGALDVTTLWRSLGNAAPAIVYPHEELLAERTKFLSSYSPAVPLTTNPELPAFTPAAPYTAKPVVSRISHGRLIPTLPDDFIDAPLGPNDMFSEGGPQTATIVGGVKTFTAAPKNFGGAIANSKKGIDIAQAGFPAGTELPDYNLDGDRGYAWPCWDVEPAPMTTGTTVVAGDPLAPDAPANAAAGVATVHAVPVTG